MYDPNSLGGKILSHCLRLDGWPMRAYCALHRLWSGEANRQAAERKPRPDAASQDKAS